MGAQRTCAAVTAWQEDPVNVGMTVLTGPGLPTDTQATSGQAGADEQQFEQQRRRTTSYEDTPR